ncbi:MAG: formate/nitrite transporter family protein [Planctomycetales bacterium]|nr:formate/nitrite transporter family protein [Planctomycetales bacterium]
MSEKLPNSALKAESEPQDDLTDNSDSAEPKKPSQQIMRHEMKEALAAFDRSTLRLFFSGLSAGLEIGFSLFLMAVMLTLVRDELPHAISAILIASMYSFGFILVILGRSELFTEQTSLAVLPVLSGRAPFKGLLRLWSVIYVANIIGAAAFAGMIAYIGPSLGVIDPQVFTDLAQKVVHHPPLVILVSGILAGWLMGLLSWLVAAGRDTISQIVIVWMVTTTIGIGHLHHSIVGSVEVLAGLFTSGETTFADFGHFLLWTTLGNAIGGPVFLALLKHTHARAEEPIGRNHTV